MSLSLNVLNHLGIHLYSNVPAVLSEAVANAWDADAETVRIEIRQADGCIVITDDGCGMSVEDANERFLRVGYQRRGSGESEKNRTPGLHRLPMGRKGIGKLSLFSIADEVTIHTVKGGERHGFRMVLPDIQAQVSATDNGVYEPIPVDPAEVTIEHGTQLTLRGLRKRVAGSGTWIRRKLARRFSVIGDAGLFSVFVDGERITSADRAYYDKLQYLWHYGEEGRLCSEAAKPHGHLDHAEPRCGAVTPPEDEVLPRCDVPGGYKVRGWLATVELPRQLKDGPDNLNKILVMVRGKVAQEDILEEFAEARFFTKYLIGEIHADFLDTDGADDIATSSRQEIVRDDVRYRALLDFLRAELKHIATKWTELRRAAGERQARQSPAIDAWFKSLGERLQSRARRLFGTIAELPSDDEAQRRQLYAHGVLAFEALRHRENLEALDRVDHHDVEALVSAFRGVDDLEAAYYHRIVSERVRVVEAMQEKVQANELEAVLQRYLFDHLWLLDPAWERATQTEYMEKAVETAFAAAAPKPGSPEAKGRVDIGYRASSGKQVIVELKRADRRVKATELINQVDKYRLALQSVLDQISRGHEPIEIVCVVGAPLRDWDEAGGRAKADGMLRSIGARVVTYQELLENANRAYQSFLERRRELGRLRDVLAEVEGSVIAEVDDSKQ
jgi:hypothetical protein